MGKVGILCCAFLVKNLTLLSIAKKIGQGSFQLPWAIEEGVSVDNLKPTPAPPPPPRQCPFKKQRIS